MPADLAVAQRECRSANFARDRVNQRAFELAAGALQNQLGHAIAG